MSVVLQTGVMYYRENQSDDWHPLILKADADLSSFIEDYSQRTWELGEYCRYHNVINRCTTPITTPETWNSSHWTATDIGEELENIRFSLSNAIAIVIKGNKSTAAASVGQYVYLKDSTISGKSDGLYTAAQTIPANTAITGAYLTAVSGGGLNSVLKTNTVQRNKPYGNNLDVVVNGNYTSKSLLIIGKPNTTLSTGTSYTLLSNLVEELRPAATVACNLVANSQGHLAYVTVTTDGTVSMVPRADFTSSGSSLAIYLAYK